MNKILKTILSFIAIATFISGIYGAYYGAISGSEESMMVKDKGLKLELQTEIRILKEDLSNDIDRSEDRAFQRIENHEDGVKPLLQDMQQMMIKQGQSISKIEGKLEK